MEHHGVERGTLSTSQHAASAASCCSSTSTNTKLLRCVKDVPETLQLVDCSSMLSLKDLHACRT